MARPLFRRALDRMPTGADTGGPPLLEELRQRLIHIEAKSDLTLEQLAAIGRAGGGFAGHPDQAYGGMTYAQFGEDLIVLGLFDLLGIENPSYLDVGAHHPFNISNTALLYQRGSRGINVEANPQLIEAFHRHRPEDVNLNVGVAPTAGQLDFYMIDESSGRNTFRRDVAMAFVAAHPQFSIQRVLPIQVLPLADIVAQHAGGRFPDFLSLDVEGLDYDILAATSFDTDRPLVICVEMDHGSDPTVMQRLARLLRDKGYGLYMRTVANLIMVHHSVLPILQLPAD